MLVISALFQQITNTKSVAVVLAHLPDSDVSGSYWSMTITAFALFISAIVLYTQHNLSLYQAILVSVLLYMHAYATLYCLLAATPHTDPRATAPLLDGRTPREIERAWWMQRLSALPVVLIATMSAMFIWVRAPSFGSQPECNRQTLFTIFGIQLSATRAGRFVALVLSSAHCYPLLVGILYGTDFFIWDIRTPAAYTNHSGVRIPVERLRRRAERRMNEINELEQQKLIRPPSRNPILRALHSVKVAYFVFLRDYRHQAYVFYFRVLVACFVVIMEFTIQTNKGLLQDASSDNTWTLGQVSRSLWYFVNVT